MAGADSGAASRGRPVTVRHGSLRPGAVADTAVHAGSRGRAYLARPSRPFTAAELAELVTAHGTVAVTAGQAHAYLVDFAARGIVAPAGDGAWALTSDGLTIAYGLTGTAKAARS